MKWLIVTIIHLVVIVDHLNPFSFGRYDSGSNGHIKLSFRARLDPHIVALKKRERIREKR